MAATRGDHTPAVSLLGELPRVPRVSGLCFGGLYALTTFQQGRYERVDFMRKSQTQREFDLEEELDSVLKNMDLKDYEPVPIPDTDGTSRTRVG